MKPESADPVSASIYIIGKHIVNHVAILDLHSTFYPFKKLKSKNFKNLKLDTYQEGNKKGISSSKL